MTLRGLIQFLVPVGLLLALLFVWSRYDFFNSVSLEFDAMSPTLEKGEWFVLRRGPVPRERGVVVKYRLGPEDKQTRVGRVAAWEGETIRIDKGKIFLQGEDGVEQPHEWPELKPAAAVSMPKIRVPKGHLFILVDRWGSEAHGNDIDSRKFGVIPIVNVPGRTMK